MCQYRRITASTAQCLEPLHSTWKLPASTLAGTQCTGTTGKHPGRGHALHHYPHCPLELQLSPSTTRLGFTQCTDYRNPLNATLPRHRHPSGRNTCCSKASTCTHLKQTSLLTYTRGTSLACAIGELMEIDNWSTSHIPHPSRVRCMWEGKSWTCMR